MVDFQTCGGLIESLTDDLLNHKAHDVLLRMKGDFFYNVYVYF